MLEVLGLTTAESAAYVALVENPRSTAADLAARASLDRQQAADAVQQLARRGLISRLPGGDERYLAVAPDVAIDPLISRQEERLRHVRHASDQLKEAFRESARYTHPAELIEVISGRENIASRVRAFNDTAQAEVRGFDRPPYAAKAGYIQSDELQRLREGVAFRVIYTPEAISVPGRLEGDIRPGLERGEQARVRSKLPVKMLIVDDRFCLVPVDTGARRVESALVIHPCDLFDALVALFESEWIRAIPLRSYLNGHVTPTDEPRPGDTAAALLAGLSAGLTDASIARSLGWSLRTTQRHLQRLMLDLDAATRFQAGMQARDRGWA